MFFPILIVALFSANAVRAEWRILKDLCETTKIADHLENWCSETIGFCEWEGLSCNGEDLLIIKIQGVPLDIELPDSFYGPPRSVEQVTLKNCGLKGRFKGSTQMLAFTSLDLSDNELEGELPYRLVTQFITLDLSNNKFTGAPGLCKFKMTRVWRINLSNNHFEEDLSGCTAGLWPGVSELRISNNLFYGTAPAPYAMSVYDISNNKFFAIRDTALKEVASPTGGTAEPGQFEALRFTFCSTAGNAFTVRAPDWMQLYETGCAYEWTSLNTRYEPTTIQKNW